MKLADLPKHWMLGLLNKHGKWWMRAIITINPWCEVGVKYRSLCIMTLPLFLHPQNSMDIRCRPHVYITLQFFVWKGVNQWISLNLVHAGPVWEQYLCSMNNVKWSPHLIFFFFFFASDNCRHGWYLLQWIFHYFTGPNWLSNGLKRKFQAHWF